MKKARALFNCVIEMRNLCKKINLLNKTTTYFSVKNNKGMLKLNASLKEKNVKFSLKRNKPKSVFGLFIE